MSRALGALRAAGELGIAVPERLEITGWDDVMAARYALLTTVRRPMRERRHDGDAPVPPA